MTKERINELFNTKGAALAVCVGSWFAYTSRNAHALGSCYNGHYYINYDILEGAEELAEVLAFLGWTEQEQEETFIQDLDGGAFDFSNCDYISAFKLAEVYTEHRDELTDNLEKVKALLDAGIFSLNSAEDLEELADSLDNYDYRDGITGEDYEAELVEECGRDVPEWLQYYIDYAAMARDAEINGDIIETKNGLLICY